MRYAEIAVDAPTGHSRTFSYHVPDDMILAPGQLVRVPFGVRALQGIVFEITSSPQVEETRPVSRTLSDAPVLNSHQLSLARWMSAYYICSLFEAAAPMLPPGARVGSRTVLSINPEFEDPESAAQNELQSQVIEIVREQESVDIERLASRLGERSRNAVSSLVRRGALLRRSQSNRAATGPRYVESLRVSNEGMRALHLCTIATRLAESEELVAVSEARRKYGGEVVRQLLDCDLSEIKRTTIGPPPRYTEYLRVNTNAQKEIENWFSTRGKRAPRQTALVTKLAKSTKLMTASEARREFGSSAVRTLLSRGWLMINKIASGPRFIECLRTNKERAQRISQIINSVMESNEFIAASEVRRNFGNAIVRTLAGSRMAGGREDTGIPRPAGGQCVRS